MQLSLQQRRSIATLTYAYLDPGTDAECTADWTGPLASAVARGIEVLGAQRCDDGRFAWFAQETGEAYLSTAETVGELGAAYIDQPEAKAQASATSLYSLWCAGDFDSEAVPRERIEALQLEAGEHFDADLVATCQRALDGDGAAYVAAVVLIVEAQVERSAE
jgi:hypothetical protein